MILEASQLRGWPKERAELYGKPHLGARYTGKRTGAGGLSSSSSPRAGRGT